MKDKAGSMGAGMAWGFAIGSVVLATILGFIGVHGFVGTVLNIAVYMAGGYAAVFMTKASTGKGIVAFLVAGILSGIASFIIVKMAASAAMSAVGDSMKAQMAAAGAKTGDAALNAQMAQAGNAVAGGLGMMVAVMAFVGSLIWCFLFGMVGCFIGGAMKKSALGGAAGVAKAA